MDSGVLIGFPRPPRARRALFDSTRGQWCTYGELTDAVERVGDELNAPRKALTFCFTANDVGSIVGYLAALGREHAVALIDRSFPAAVKSSLLDTYQPEFLLDAFAGGGALEELHHWAYEPVPCPDAFVHVWRRQDFADAPVHPDLAVLLSTSGSTGSPKFVRLSRKNIVSNAAAISEALGITSDECAITSLPIHYAYGLSVLNSHVVAGARLAITGDSVLTPAFWTLMRDARCTSFAGVPYTYQMLDRIGFHKFELPSLQTLTQAGGKLSDELILRFHRTMAAANGRFIVMYGQTEATARMAYLAPEYLPEKVGSVGVAVPGGRLWIECGDGKAWTQGQEGQVVYQGPNVMLGYAHDRNDLSLGNEQSGILHTGDIGFLDKDGFLRLTGRGSRIAKVFGLRLNLDEVEEQLRLHGPTAVIQDGNKLVIFCEHGNDRVFATYREQLSECLRLHQSALEFRRVQALPRTSFGKTDYYRLQSG